MRESHKKMKNKKKLPKILWLINIILLISIVLAFNKQSENMIQKINRIYGKNVEESNVTEEI